MDPFVRRLVERLFDPDAQLSRNRHFSTFDNPEGRQALRIRRRLEALARELEACRAEGGRPTVSRATDARGDVHVRLELSRLKTTRTAVLEQAEFELLQRLPAVQEALREA